MKRLNWGIVIIAIFLLVAAFTNPSLDDHRQEVKAIFNQRAQETLSETESDGFKDLGALIGNSFVENLINNIITRDNYLFFSITKATWKGESKAIGYGVFGNVFLSKDLKEKLNDGVGNDLKS